MMKRPEADSGRPDPWKIVHDKPVDRLFIQCAHCGSWRYMMDRMEVRYQMGLFPPPLGRVYGFFKRLFVTGRVATFIIRHIVCGMIMLEDK